MKVTMTAARPVSVVMHEDSEYRPNARGEFEVDERHVEALRSHGLAVKGEAGVPVAETVHDFNARLLADNARLKAELATKGAKR